MTTISAEVKHPLRPTQIKMVEKPTRTGGLHRMMRINVEAAKDQEPERQDDAGVDPTLLGLVSLRLAQIHRHSGKIEKYQLDLKARGESEERLIQLEKWRKSSCFSDKETSVLALVEAISLNPTTPVHKQLLEEARCYFKKEGLAPLLLAIMAINDRICRTLSSVTEPPPPSQPQKVFQEQRICPLWRKLAHQLTQKVVITKEPRIFG